MFSCINHSTCSTLDRQLGPFFVRMETLVVQVKYTVQHELQALVLSIFFLAQDR